MESLKERYNKEVIPEFKEKFGLTNKLEVPHIEKVVVNVGIGKYLKDSNIIKEIEEILSSISGQKPVFTKSRKSIAGFKIRQGLEVGIKTTLRGQRKWDFLERLVGAAIPRIRDFQGIKESSVDSNGNLNIGFKEHIVFPEIIAENVKNIISFQVTVVTNAKDRKRGLEFFRMMKFPIVK